MPPTNTRESPWRFSRDERTLVLGALLNSMAFFAALPLSVRPLVIRLSERLPHGPLVTSGCACFAVAFAFVWLGASDVVALYVAIVFWTLGEAILPPLPDIAVHAIATDDRKGTYFGLSELRYLGFFAGPVLGGMLLDLSDPVYFTGMALAIFLCVPLLSRTAKPDLPLGNN